MDFLKAFPLFLVISVAVVDGDIREVVTSVWKKGTLPQEISLKVPKGELKLRRESQRVANVEVTEKGRLALWEEKTHELFGTYSDERFEASFSVGVASSVHMYGSFKMRGKLFSIRPTPPHFRPHHRTSFFDPATRLNKIKISGFPHLLERISPNIEPIISSNDNSNKASSNMYDDVVRDRFKTHSGKREQATSNKLYIMSELQFKLLSQTFSPQSDKKQTKTIQHLTVELYVVLDYSIYKKWLELHKNSDKAITDLRYYYAHIVNGMSKRYERMNTPGVKLSVSIAGYYIAKSRKDAPFTDSSKVRINSTTVEVYKTLDMFFEWIRNKVQEQPPSLPRFDAAMLFTRQILAVRNNETKHIRIINGLADIGALCQVNSVSIVKDYGMHGTIDTATHELAHNLGVNHDGFENNCLSNDQYIMALAPNPVENEFYNNTISFSNCSKADFLKYIDKLNRNKRNCMLDGWGSVEKDNVSNLLQSHPGQNYSLNYQCKIIYGRESFFCGGGGSRIRDLCMGMFCYRPSTRSCKTEVQLKAADGTSCDNKSWCQVGHCVADDQAPEFNNSCPYGDFKDKVPLLGASHIECRQIRHKHSSLCYKKFYSDLCCATCAQINTKKEGCEYGDLNTTKCSRIKLSQCYDEVQRKECCRTCELKKKKKSPPDCQYGDRTDWCTNKTIFGSFNCYNHQDNHLCCATCKKYHKGPEGCEYGDKGNGCDIKDCNKNSYLQYCCKTCASFIDPKVILQKNSPTINARRHTPAPFLIQDNAIEDLKCTKDQASWCDDLKSYQCYNAHTTCCGTCLTYHQTDKKGCEYGDRSTECKVDNCKGKSYIDTCCSTCSSFFKYQPTTTSLALSTSPPTRPPMGVSITNKSNMKATSTYSYQQTTNTNIPYNSKLTTSKPINGQSITSNHIDNHTTITYAYPIECPKGDRAAWCKRIKPSQCYKSDKTCCQSCAQFYDPSIENCEYGDKASWCEKHVMKQTKDCIRSSSSVPKTCCKSCLNHKIVPKEATMYSEEREGDGVPWLCAAGDQASYCSSITKPHACYSYKNICCATCTHFIDTTVPNCQFGDKVNWCDRYRGDEKSCSRRDISRQCCKTCAHYVYNGKVPKSSLCTNQAAWCAKIKPSQCYHHVARSTCCDSCYRHANGNEGECRYGDQVTWCEEMFCKSNPKECCHTCANLTTGI